MKTIPAPEIRLVYSRERVGQVTVWGIPLGPTLLLLLGVVVTFWKVTADGSDSNQITIWKVLYDGLVTLILTV